MLTGVDVVGAVLYVTPFRNTSTRSGRSCQVFNVFLTDESGGLLDVVVWTDRPSLRNLFFPSRMIGLLDLRFSSFHSRTGVTTCVFGDRSGVLPSPWQRPHFLGVKSVLLGWLSSQQGRQQVQV